MWREENKRKELPDLVARERPEEEERRARGKEEESKRQGMKDSEAWRELASKGAKSRNEAFGKSNTARTNGDKTGARTVGIS